MGLLTKKDINGVPFSGLRLTGVDEQIARAVIRRGAAIHATGDLARIAQDETARLHGYTEYRVLTTLLGIDFIRQALQADGKLSPAVEAFHQRRLEKYLADVEAISDEAHRQINAIVEQEQEA